MKFHWGHGIAAFYSLFAFVLISAVIKSTTFDNSLVAKDYYARDIAYQNVLDRKMNSQSLKKAVAFKTNNGSYQISFPIAELDAAITGKIQLYCPSTADRDIFWPVSLTEEGKQFLPVQSLPAGRYKLIINWSADQRDYLDEFTFHHKG